MNNLKQYIIMFFKNSTFVVLLVLSLFSQNSSAKETISDVISREIKKSSFNKDHFSIKIESQKNKSLFSLNEDKLRIPASLTKIFTAGAVLDEFKPNHQFVTELWLEKKKDKTNLYLVGGGDPSFVSEKLWYLVNEFTQTRIKEITGDIIVDASLFDEDFYPGRSSARVDRAFDAPISAMSFNWNSMTLHLSPKKNNKENNKKLVDVFLDPNSEYIKLNNDAVVGKKSTYKIRRKKGTSGDSVSVSGIFPEQKNKKTIYKNITNPSLWAGYNLKEFLKQRGVVLKGNVRKGVLSEGSVKVAESKSKPVSDIVKDLMKFSNNYIAEMLTKKLSLARTLESGGEKKKGNIVGGLEKIKKFIVKQGIKPESFKMVNPSGLTRENKFSVKQINIFLKKMLDQFNISPEFITSLPIAGIDGTLKRRMNNSKATRLVRAKTGLLSGVVGIAGYIKKENEEINIFSFIYNGPSGNEHKVRKFFDNLLIGVLK